ncbi:flagellar hook-associated protein 1 FlgK [Lachnospiraceae bacterium]|nr:flagellar hook-associated protein 1 FlgK [Lachnospiraceae bacterium]
MTSQFFGLMIGYSGLTAYQTAENTVANNASNINTEGYTRQVVEQTAANALRTYTTYGMAGAGVNVTAIKQLRNEYYDIKFRANEADVGRYETQNIYMAEIEQYFKDSTALKGFTAIYTEEFYAALNDLADNPGTTSTRASFLGKAQSLAEYFRAMSANLTREQEILNSEIKSQVDQVNEYSEQIAVLNKQINLIEIQGGTALDLRDQRNLVVDKLSKIVDVTVTETPVYNAGDPDNPTGAHRYQVNISNGCSLVDGYEYNTLEVRARGTDAKYNQTDADGLYDLYWSNTGMEFSVLADNLSGTLKALFELRDGNNNDGVEGEFIEFTQDPTRFALDKEGNKIDDGSGGYVVATDVSISVPIDEGETLESVISKLNIADEGSIRISGTLYKYDGWTVEYPVTDANGRNTAVFTFGDIAYTDANGNEKHEPMYNVTPGKKCEVGDNIDYQGVPYYQAQMNQWIRQFSYRFNYTEEHGSLNNLVTQNAQNLYGDDMTISFWQWMDTTTGELRNFGEYYTANPGDTVNTAITKAGSGTIAADYSLESYYYSLTASNFYVNKTIVTDPSLMSTTARDADVNVSADDVVKELLELKDNKSKMVYRGCNSTEFLNMILSDIALNESSAKNFTKNAENISRAISKQKESVSGVDDNEEALDLVKFQNAYNLNAKIIQTMTEIYDRLILETGV